MAKRPDIYLDTIVKALTAQLREHLKSIVIGKLTQAGVQADAAQTDALVDHIFSGKEEPFTWNDGGPREPSRDISLSFNDDDIADIDKLVKKIFDRLPAITRTASANIAGAVFKDSMTRWPAQHADEVSAHQGFRDRLEERWGRAFAPLRMLRTISIDIGREALKRHLKSRSKQQQLLREVLLRLHSRACQVTGEIVTLIENGYADGAMARWRTLHEISVVAWVLDEFGEEIAERYLAHDAVESKKGLDVYLETRPGQKDFSDKDVRSVRKSFDAAVQRFGKDFANEYGWASHHLKKPKPTFRDLEVVADKALMRSPYKSASYGVHAGVKGISFRLGLMGNPGFLAGSSNAGFSEPGRLTGYAMVQLNLLVLNFRRVSFEKILMIRQLGLLQRTIDRAFLRAERKLAYDETERLKSKKS